MWNISDETWCENMTWIDLNHGENYLNQYDDSKYYLYNWSKNLIIN